MQRRSPRSPRSPLNRSAHRKRRKRRRCSSAPTTGIRPVDHRPREPPLRGALRGPSVRDHRPDRGSICESSCRASFVSICSRVKPSRRSRRNNDWWLYYSKSAYVYVHRTTTGNISLLIRYSFARGRYIYIRKVARWIHRLDAVGRTDLVGRISRVDAGWNSWVLLRRGVRLCLSRQVADANESLILRSYSG